MDRQGQGIGTGNARKAWKLNVFSVAALIVLILLYSTLTIYSSGRLGEQTERISQHPFEVVIAVGDIKFYVSQIWIYIERLINHNTDDDINLLNKNIYELSEDISKSVNLLKKHYLGDPDDITQLSERLDNFLEQQKVVFALANSEHTDEEIEEYILENIVPVYRSISDMGEHIIASARSRVVQYGKLSNELRRFSLGGSAILLTLTVIILLLTQYILHRQRQELEYRAALFDYLSKTIDDTFVIWDTKSGTESYTALNMERVLGHRAERDEHGVYKGFRREDAEEIAAAVRNWDFASPYTKVVQFTRPDGEIRCMTIRIYRPERIIPVLYICFFTDCTEDIRSRQTLQDAMESAKKANMAKSEFLSRMSHEVRTPLNAIIGMTTIAAVSVTDSDRVKDCLEKINFSSKHLLMLINDVLDMAKIESNKMLLHNEPFDLFETMNTFVATLYPQAKAKGLEFESVLEGFGQRTMFIGDPLRMNQVLLNIASNAVKFTPAGGQIKLHVSKVASKGKTDIIRFVIADTGIGMTPEELERCFKPFEQANSSIAGRFGGTGLGMSITLNLVTLMDGRFEVKSEPNVGTTCIVELPFQPHEVGDALPDFAGQNLRALVVDDEQALCEQTAALLANIRIDAQWIMDGELAINEVIRANAEGKGFDFCLIDWKMPGIDGIEITRRIRKQLGWGLPIVMISACDYSDIEAEAGEAGVNAFLSKPLYRSSMYATIEAALYKGRKPEAATPAEPDFLKGKKLLIAEDNELNQEILTTMLDMADIQSDVATNGREAVEMFLASPPGVYAAILMDVQMPIMDGLEATRAIRASVHPRAKTMPIVAVTANAFSEDVAKTLAAGMDAHISKPIEMDQLYLVLGKLLLKDGTCCNDQKSVVIRVS